MNSFVHPLTLTGVENMKITTAYTEQKLEKIHQQLQQVHQQIQRIKMGKTLTTQEQLNQVMATYKLLPPLLRPGLSAEINYQKAVIAAQNGNYMPLIAIYSQAQPPTWRNYFVGCYQMAQKDHATAKVDTK